MPKVFAYEEKNLLPSSYSRKNAMHYLKYASINERHLVGLALNFIELLKHKKYLSKQNYTYQNKATNQNTMSCEQSVTRILLVYAKQKCVKQYFLLKQLYKIGSRSLMLTVYFTEILSLSDILNRKILMYSYSEL